MGDRLKGKKVLFIGPVFYDYHSIIIKKMRSLGGNVVFFPEKNDGFLFGILNNINPNLINYYQKKYYKKLLREIKGECFTHFFLIRGYKIPDFFIEKLKELNPNIECIIYQWDSDQNNPYFHILKYFDKAFTFDFKDFSESKKLKFLQLFYTDEIAALSANVPKKYDFFCFSSFTLDRYTQTLKFIEFCKENDHKYYVFCFIPATTYFRLKYLKGIKLKRDFLSFKPMPRQQYLKLLEESEIVVDLSHSTQTGLSMRIIEAYGAGKKILTTNVSILNNPIYSSDWCQIVEDNNFEKTNFTLNSKSQDKRELFIDNWIEEFFT